MPSLSRHRFGRGAAVARQHDDAQALLVQQPDRFRRRCPDRIGDAEQAGRLPSTATNMTVWPSPRNASAACSSSPGAMPQCLRTARVAQCDRLCPPTVPATPLPVIERKSLTAASARSCAPARRDDRGRQRMFAGAFQAGGQPQQVAVHPSPAGRRRPTSGAACLRSVFRSCR